MPTSASRGDTARTAAAIDCTHPLVLRGERGNDEDSCRRRRILPRVSQVSDACRRMVPVLVPARQLRAGGSVQGDVHCRRSQRVQRVDDITWNGQTHRRRPNSQESKHVAQHRLRRKTSPASAETITCPSSSPSLARPIRGTLTSTGKSCVRCERSGSLTARTHVPSRPLRAESELIGYSRMPPRPCQQTFDYSSGK